MYDQIPGHAGYDDDFVRDDNDDVDARDARPDRASMN